MLLEDMIKVLVEAAPATADALSKVTGEEKVRIHDCLKRFKKKGLMVVSRVLPVKPGQVSRPEDTEEFSMKGDQ